MPRAISALLAATLLLVSLAAGDDPEATRRQIEAKKAAIDADCAQRHVDLALWCADKGLIKEAEAEYTAALALVGVNEKWDRERTNLKARANVKGRPNAAADREEYDKTRKRLQDSYGKLYGELAKKAKDAGLDALATALEAQAGGSAPAKPPDAKDPKDAPPKGSGKKVAPVLTSPEQAAERVNFYRKLAGLDPVALDADLSKGAVAHAKYLSLNAGDPSTQGLGAHTEKKELPGYSEEGQAAGQASDIEWGPPAGAVEELMSELFHRIPILRPSLARIGVGQADNGHITVIDLTQGLTATDVERVIRFPVPDQKDVPTRFGSETPDPIPANAARPCGYPITLTEYERSLKVTDVAASLIDEKGAAVECHLSTPERPAHAIFQLNTIGMIPVRPLASGTKYTVHITCKIGGSPFDQTWSFTTAK